MVGNFNSILKTSLVLLLGVVFIYFFFKFLPVLLVVGVVVYAFFKIRGRIKAWREGKQQDINLEEKEEEIFSKKYDFTNKEVIDVEYHDVEKQHTGGITK